DRTIARIVEGCGGTVLPAGADAATARFALRQAAERRQLALSTMSVASIGDVIAPTAMEDQSNIAVAGGGRERVSDIAAKVASTPAVADDAPTAAAAAAADSATVIYVTEH
ncbi:unnamed protein product, partial [Phaeothamnion confervicola]